MEKFRLIYYEEFTEYLRIFLNYIVYIYFGCMKENEVLIFYNYFVSWMRKNNYKHYHYIICTKPEEFKESTCFKDFYDYDD